MICIFTRIDLFWVWVVVHQVGQDARGGPDQPEAPAAGDPSVVCPGAATEFDWRRGLTEGDDE